MRISPSEISERLSANAEAFCRYYLSSGRREGNYWIVGDPTNSAGRSMYVRLAGPSSGKHRAGKWQDCADPDSHGDLLDIIRHVKGLSSFRDVMDEARRFLSLPDFALKPDGSPQGQSRSAADSLEKARRLFAMSRDITGTLVERYLHSRGLTALHECAALRYNPECFYRPNKADPVRKLPAMVSAVTDVNGHLQGLHRTWLSPDGMAKADVDTPKRAMGTINGHGVRFGTATEVAVAGEGIESMLSLRVIMPELPAIAALSAPHLSALVLQPSLRRLYVAMDNDPTGENAFRLLANRAEDAGVQALPLKPAKKDFNIDLTELGVDALRSHVRAQLHPEDRAMCLTS